MNFEKTQEQLDTLRNLTWQNGKLIEQNETLTKMLEEKEDSALIVEIEEAKKVLADAINTKGGNSTPDESFQKLASDIQTLPYAGISAKGIVQTEPFSFLKYVTTDINNEITEINDSEITTIKRHDAFRNNIALREVVMSKLASLIGNSIFQDCILLQSVKLDNLINIFSPNCFQGCTSLQMINFKNLTTISSISCFHNCTNLKSVNFDNFTAMNSRNVFYNCFNLQTITFGILIYCNNDFFGDNKLNIRNISIGQDTDINLPFQQWTATNVIAEGQSGIDELNSNLYNNLLTKLYDHSQDGQTRTLRLGWLAHVTQENIDYANSKGWTLTT
jgi:hypothetical protein